MTDVCWYEMLAGIVPESADEGESKVSQEVDCLERVNHCGEFYITQAGVAGDVLDKAEDQGAARSQKERY